MGVRVAVAGASGYAGGELLRLIASHPGLELGPVAAGTSAGAPVTSVHPQLPGLAGHILGPADPGLLGSADLVFLALPHAESAGLAATLPSGTAVVDLSASFRLADPGAWASYYRTGHAGTWTYGLPELPGARERISSARRVASPGCYATAAIVALAPLLAAGLVEPQDIVIVGASGTSGAGRTPSAALLATEVMGAVSAYQVGGTHRHIPEIEQALAEAGGRTATVSFTPLLVPMPRGILATCTARLVPGQPGTQALREALAGAYHGEPFVHLLPDGHWPATAATAGSNAVQLQAAADAHAGRAVVVAALDNLGKGAAGQAIQAANLMLGLPETAGLTAHGVAP
ncbi:MAG TPA: N-acetyl-gamma-glutamyl-phosphate reductase [Streptosporangiaceae bacterium]|jgi:N-acetyl-gamma-glutamyl-phosphate reductase|nr:N-acetyl-gamma-glutamyl-phosphate reductase [Streptosporangiaceae bacterium]